MIEFLKERLYWSGGLLFRWFVKQLVYVARFSCVLVGCHLSRFDFREECLFLVCWLTILVFGY